MNSNEKPYDATKTLEPTYNQGSGSSSSTTTESNREATPSEEPNIEETVIMDGTSLHTISVLTQNKPGVLGRVSLVFSRRGFNIESLVVSPTQNKALSRFTITVNGDQANLEQVIRQIYKLVNVINVYDHHQHKGPGVIERELLLVKINLEENNQNIFSLIDHFKAATLDISQNTMVIQVTGSTEKIDSFLKIIGKYSILEVIRTGKVLIRRGSKTI